MNPFPHNRVVLMYICALISFRAVLLEILNVTLPLYLPAPVSMTHWSATTVRTVLSLRMTRRAAALMEIIIVLVETLTL